MNINPPNWKMYTRLNICIDTPNQTTLDKIYYCNNDISNLDYVPICNEIRCYSKVFDKKSNNTITLINHYL